MRLKYVFVAAVALGIVSPTAVADAKRPGPPKTTICNKTKHKLYVAQLGYAGAGTYTSSGWRYIKPGACDTFNAYAYHFRGKRTFSGLTKRTQKACITYAKVFNVHNVRRGMKATCKARKGVMVDFHWAAGNWRTPGKVDVTK